MGGKHRKGNMKVSNEVMEIRRGREGKMEMRRDEVSGGARGKLEGSGHTALHSDREREEKKEKEKKSCPSGGTPGRREKGWEGGEVSGGEGREGDRRGVEEESIGVERGVGEENMCL